MNNETKKLRLGGVYNFVLNTEKTITKHGQKRMYSNLCGKVEMMDKKRENFKILVYSYKCEETHFSGNDFEVSVKAEEVVSIEPVLVGVATL